MEKELFLLMTIVDAGMLVNLTLMVELTAMGSYLGFLLVETQILESLQMMKYLQLLNGWFQDLKSGDGQKIYLL